VAFGVEYRHERRVAGGERVEGDIEAAGQVDDRGGRVDQAPNAGCGVSAGVERFDGKSALEAAVGVDDGGAGHPGFLQRLESGRPGRGVGQHESGAAIASTTGTVASSGSPTRRRWPGLSARLASWLRYMVSSLRRTMSQASPTAIMPGSMTEMLPVISATISITASGAREMLPKQHIIPTIT